MKISEQAFLAAWQNQKLVRGALKYAHVRQDYTNYEDFLQEGIIIYAQMLSKRAELSRKELDRRSFRKIIWHTIDLLRRDQRVVEHQTELENAFAVSQYSNWNNYLAMKKELSKMSKLERMLFFDNLVFQKPINALARETGVSRTQLHRVKRGLVHHLQSILEN